MMAKDIPEDKIREWVFARSDKEFAALWKATVDRGEPDDADADRSFPARVKRALVKLSDEDLEESVRSAIVRGDSATWGRFSSLLAESEEKSGSGSIQVKITDYRIKDESVPRIVAKCDSELFAEICHVVDRRRNRVVDSLESEDDEDEVEYVEPEDENKPRPMKVFTFGGGLTQYEGS